MGEKPLDVWGEKPQHQGRVNALYPIPNVREKMMTQM